MDVHPPQNGIAIGYAAHGKFFSDLFGFRSTLIFHCRRMAKAELTAFQMLEAGVVSVFSEQQTSWRGFQGGLLAGGS